jgi:hypothetical protein
VSIFRVLRTSRATISRTFLLDEVATDATGTVNVAVTRYNGTVVQAVAATGPVANAYTFTFVGSDTLDELTLTWTATVGGDAIVLDQDIIQVVGGFYFGLSEARSIDPKFSDTNRYTTQTLIDRRVEVEDEFEGITGQAYVPRYARDTLSGRGQNALKLVWPRLRRVLSVAVNGVALDTPAVNTFGVDILGMLRFDRGLSTIAGGGGRPYLAGTSGWPYGVGNLVVEYEHGMDRPPTDVIRAAKLRMKSLLLTQQSPLPDRAERIATTEMGLVMLAVATKDSTGIPEVDAALARHPSPRPGFG